MRGWGLEASRCWGCAAPKRNHKTLNARGSSSEESRPIACTPGAPRTYLDPKTTRLVKDFYEASKLKTHNKHSGLDLLGLGFRVMSRYLHARYC